MRQSAQSLDRHAASEILDELLEEITRKLQAGEPVNLEDYSRKHPELTEQLGRLLPGMELTR